jgi:hypothetical protein
MDFEVLFDMVSLLKLKHRCLMLEDHPKVCDGSWRVLARAIGAHAASSTEIVRRLLTAPSAASI